MLSSSLMAMQQLRSSSALAASARWMATAAANSGTSAGSKKSAAEPSFFYAPPGSSMREPLLISLSDPVYYYDAGKSSLSDALPNVDQQVPAEQPQRPGKLPMVALTGSDKPAAEPAGGKPHPYRMTDDMANQPYTISNRNSMRDPKYVSMGEPLYVVDGKPKQ